MIVAIPQYNDEIAPCFEAARVFLISTLADGQVVESRLQECTGGADLDRVSLIRKSNVNTLICNGIKGYYRGMLQAAGVIVISDITCPVGEALEQYVAGKLLPHLEKITPSDYGCGIALDDLICWTRDLLESNGYEVTCPGSSASFPIDLEARIACPVCGRKMRVAVCCGVHMYRPDREIQQFHLACGSNYHARLYVHRATPEMVEICGEYGIDILDPDVDQADIDADQGGIIPLLKRSFAKYEGFCGKSRR